MGIRLGSEKTPSVNLQAQIQDGDFRHHNSFLGIGTSLHLLPIKIPTLSYLFYDFTDSA